MKLYIKVATSNKLSLHIKIFKDGSKNRIDYKNQMKIYYQWVYNENSTKVKIF